MNYPENTIRKNYLALYENIKNYIINRNRSLIKTIETRMEIFIK